MPCTKSTMSSKVSMQEGDETVRQHTQTFEGGQVRWHGSLTQPGHCHYHCSLVPKTFTQPLLSNKKDYLPQVYIFLLHSATLCPKLCTSPPHVPPLFHAHRKPSPLAKPFATMPTSPVGSLVVNPTPNSLVTHASLLYHGSCAHNTQPLPLDPDLLPYPLPVL
jgi:hypothetical protein